MMRVLLLALGFQFGLMGDARVAAEPVEAFRLPRAADGQSLEVAPGDAEVTVVCFLATECPVARLYASRLGKLSAELTGRGVRFVGVSSNRQDSRDDVIAFATHYGVPFEIGMDYRNVLADRFHVQRVPEVFVLDRDLMIRYRGRVDDQYDPGQARAEPQQHYLLDAIHDVLADRPVTLASTQATGCLLGRVREPVVTSDVTYTNQIARLFQKHCIECHREGEIGPFSLTEYEEALGWGEMILEVVDNGRMPPWHADPAVGHFINERHLSEEEIANLHKWVENGMPFGDPKQLPEQQEFTSGWRLSAAPDLVLAMSDHAFEIPAEGTVDYQYFVVDPGFEEDRWVTQVEVRPGNASVLHHSLVFIRPPDGEEFRGIGWLAGYVPGQRPAQFPPGSAIRIPAGSKLVFQQHYTPSGKPQQDITQVALRFATPEEVSHEVYCLLGMNQGFEIPPQAADHVVHSSVQRLPERASLLSIMPHMHLRGKTFQLWATQADERKALLNVPDYDFNWQHAYHLTQALPLNGVEQLEFAATFDNSPQNPVNPDPSQLVVWGDQTWEEMAVVFLVVSEPRDAGDVTDAEGDTSLKTSDAPPPEPEVEYSADVRQQMAAEADRILARFDTNQDGTVTRRETPFAFRFGFSAIDANSDGKLSRQEIEEAAAERMR